MTKILLWLGVCGLTVQFVLLLVYQAYYRPPTRHIRHTDVILEPPSVRLDDLSLRERRAGMVSITNAGTESITFAAPSADCGCINARLSKQTLTAGEVAELRFTVVAPAIPGEVSRRIRLMSVDSAEMIWEIPISGSAKASVWSVPDSLHLRVAGTTPATIEMHSENVVAVDSVVSSDNAVSVLSINVVDENVCNIAIAVAADNDGKAHLDVSYHGKDDVVDRLEIPIEWRVQKDIECVPRFIELANAASEHRVIQHSLIVFTRKTVDRGDLTIASLVDWIDVVSLEKLNAGKWLLKLQEDHTSNEVFDNDVLAISVNGEGVAKETIVIRGKRM